MVTVSGPKPADHDRVVPARSGAGECSSFFRIKMFLYCVIRLLLLMYCLMYCCSVSESLCDYLIPRVNILI